MKALTARGNQAIWGEKGSKYLGQKVKAKIAHWDNVLHQKCHGNFSNSVTLHCINDIK